MPELAYIGEKILRAHVIAAEKHLTSGIVNAPERRFSLRHGHDSAPCKESAPGALPYAVPPSIAPPHRPLLANRCHRDGKLKCTTGRSARVCHPRLLFSVCRRELRRMFLDFRFRENRKRRNVSQRPNISRHKAGVATPLSVEAARPSRVRQMVDQSAVPEGRQLLRGPVRAPKHLVEQALELERIPRAFRAPPDEAAGDVLQRGGQPSVYGLEIEAIASGHRTGPPGLRFGPLRLRFRRH